MKNTMISNEKKKLRFNFLQELRETERERERERERLFVFSVLCFVHRDKRKILIMNFLPLIYILA